MAVLGERLARNHPLPDGNKRSALLSMLLFGKRNGLDLHLNEPEVISALELLASGRMSAEAFADYLRARVR